MKRILTERITLKSMVFQFVLSFVLFIFCAISVLVSVISNPFYSDLIQFIPFYFFMSFMLIPYCAITGFNSVFNYFELVKQEKENAENGDS